MISYETYKLAHIVGLMLVLIALGGVTLHVANGGTRASNSARALVGAMHGLGLLLILVAGFGLLARIGVMEDGGLPGWVWVKLGVWVLLGGLIALPYRVPGLARAMWIVVPILAGIAAYMAIFKPF